jgi:hypothetical protein
MTYAATLFGGFIAGVFMLPVTAIMFPSPGLGERRLTWFTRGGRETTVEPVKPAMVDTVKRHVRKARTVALKASGWARPTRLVRNHAVPVTDVRAYHDTPSSGGSYEFADVARQGDFVTDEQPVVEVVAVWDDEFIALELMMHDFSMRETVSA